MRFFRKVIRIRAEDSPNVRLGLKQRQLGLLETNEVIIPGVLTWVEYQQHRAMWDSVRQSIGLDAQFYEGAELLLFPPVWLDAAERRAEALRGRQRRAASIGIDPGEGSANTAMAACDELGVIELQSRTTPDTSVIRREALAFMRKHGVKPEQVVLDRGGGGRQIADDLRSDGHNVRTVAFGEPVSPEASKGVKTIKAGTEQKEDRYAYFNRRAQMYGELSELLEVDERGEPARGSGFAIPAGCRGNPADDDTILRNQLAPIPKKYDREGRLFMLPKNRKGDRNDPSAKREPCLTDLIGHSPDEADAVVLALHGILHPAAKKAVAGPLW